MLKQFNKKEFTVKDYYKFLDYLKKKNGLVPYDYYDINIFQKDSRNFKKYMEIHHDYELKKAGLSSIKIFKDMMKNGDKKVIDSWLWYQSKDKLTYCDAVEHLLIHVMLAEIRGVAMFTSLLNIYAFAMTQFHCYQKINIGYFTEKVKYYNTNYNLDEIWWIFERAKYAIDMLHYKIREEYNSKIKGDINEWIESTDSTTK